jgi:alpha-1,6-mannosyltransferase
MQSVPLVADVVEAWAPAGGGIRSYVEAKAEAWTRSGRARHLLIVPGPVDRVRQVGARTVVEISGPRIPGCAPYRFLLGQSRLMEVLRAHRPDVVELGSQYLAGATALAFSEATGARVSVFFHTDVAGAYVGPVATRLFGGAIGRLLEHRVRDRFVELTRRADLTLVSSAERVAALRDLGVPRLHALPLGVELDVFRPGAAAAGAAGAAGGEPPVDGELCDFVFVGRMDREKRVPLLLEAFAKAGDRGARARLLLVGEGPLVPEVRSAADASGGFIRHRPFEADRRRLAGLLASSDVYVTAGPHETFGLAVLEAQACGLPVLGVEAGALVDRVAPETGWLVPPDDSDALAHAVVKVAEMSETERRSAGRAARELAVRAGGWDRSLDALAELYGLPPVEAGRPAHVRAS